MTALIWRILIAVIVAALCFALIPPVMALLQFPGSGPLTLILRICVAGLCLLYIVKGPPINLPG